jgi:protein required for attachment to host cells
MQRTCIAVVDAARARLFTLDRFSDPVGVHENLSERIDLVNPARRLTPAQLFSDSRSGLGRSGGLQYGIDDHRDAHIDAIDAAFAREIADAIKRLVRDTGAGRLIVVASPRMLGALRTADLRRRGVVIDELGRNYSRLTPAQIHDQLVERGLLPTRPARPELRA